MNQSVSQILFEKHGISIKPGQKVECPFCNHKTFSIKRDDTLGKCFHPSCGRFITPHTEQRGKVYMLLEGIFYDFHLHLLNLKGKNYKNAYSYLVEERHIHPQVVTDSLIGAVPSGYDIANKFTPLIDELKAAIESKKQESKSKGRPKKSKEQTPEERLNFIIEVRTKLLRCITRHAGWLCFFCTDRYYRIVAIRFRKPYSKKFQYFKPFESVSGLFGHELFTPYTSDRLKDYNDLLIVTEGEFNQLQLQSLCLRYKEKTGIETGYVFACSVGGVNNADYEIIREISKSPVICYDNDESDAGFSLVEKALQFMSVSAFTTPESDSDLDSFILSFSSDTKAAWEAIRDLIRRRKNYPRDYRGVARQVHIIRIDADKSGDDRHRRDFETNNEVSEIIINDLRDRGKLYYDGFNSYVFLNDEKRLIEINQDNIEYHLLLDRYGLNRTEGIYKYFFEKIQVEAFTHGVRTEIHRLSYYNPDMFTLYLFNFNDQIYRISPDTFDLVDNGTDGILFLHDSKSESFEFNEDKKNASKSLLDEIIVRKINFAQDLLTPDEKRLVFTLWFLSLFFENIMPTKPILAFIGEKGSSKTTTLRKVGILLFGANFNVTPLPSDPKDFDAAVTNSTFVVLDNADIKLTWLNDKLATMATGGTIKRRELYTTNKLIEYKPRCFLGITSRAPYFRRDDVADRLLIMNVERLDEMKAEKFLLDEVIQNRDKIMSEIILKLQDVILALKNAKNDNYSSTFRMADFADFAIKVARCNSVEDKINNIFEKLSHEQSLFTLDGNPIFDLLFEWASKNPDQEVTNSELCDKLSTLADVKKNDFQYKGKNRSFAQRMKNLRSDLNEFFTITERPIGGHKKKYTFKPKKEYDEK